MFAVIAVSVLGAASCGGDESATDAGSTTTPETTGSAPTPPTKTASTDDRRAPADTADPSGIELGSPSEVPKSKGGDNSIQDYGEEAGPAERTAAARALVDFLRAYTRGDTETACALLAGKVKEIFERGFGNAANQRGQRGNPPAQDCASALKTMSAGLSPRGRASSANAVVLSLRVEGEKAFAIYRGAASKIYAMPMVNEGGAWKVGGVAGTPLS